MKCSHFSVNYVKLPTNGTDLSWMLQLERINDVGNSSLFAAAKCAKDPLCYYYCKSTDSNNNLVAYRCNYNAPYTPNIQNVFCYMVPSKYQLNKK